MTDTAATVNWTHALVRPETDLQASSIKVSTRGGGWERSSESIAGYPTVYAVTRLPPNTSLSEFLGF